MARDKKTIKFNPLDKISNSLVADISAKPPTNAPAKTNRKAVPKPAPITKTIARPMAKSGIKLSKVISKDEGLKPIEFKNESGYQELDGFVSFSDGVSRAWQSAALQYDALTQEFGFFNRDGRFIRFSSKTLKAQLGASTLMPKALMGLALGGAIGFALGYVLAKSPHNYTYFQLYDEVGETQYLRLNNKALGYIM